MNWEMWLVIFILGGAIVFFVTEWLRVDVVALGVLVALMLTGVLTTSEALAGFSNSAVLTIAGLFIVGGAVMQTGVAGSIGRRVLRIAGNDEIRLLVVLMLAVALLSGFMSDTGTVAVLLPAIVVLAKNAEISPSKLLIPLSFGSLLGGATTLIGTPPNIIVSDLLRSEGLPPFRFFSFAPMGLVLIAGGVLFMVFVGRFILPDRKSTRSTQPVATPEEIIKLYQLPERLFRLRVRRGSGLIGRTLPQSELGRLFDINVLKIMRDPEPRPEFRLGRKESPTMEKQKAEAIIPTGETKIELDDVLIVQGEGADITRAAVRWHLGVQPAKPKDEKALLNREVGVAEVIIAPRSSLQGRTLVDLRFGSRNKLTVLGLHRQDGTEIDDIKNVSLRFGDVLIVQGAWSDILALKENRRDFVVLGQPEVMIEAPRKEKAFMAMIVLLGMLVVMILGIIPVAAVVMAAALLMVLTGCLSMDDAYASIDWKSIVLIAGMLPMSTAMEKVGIVNLVATGFVETLGELGPLAVMAGLFMLTSLFTQVLSNTATTVIIAPVALAAGLTLGIQPHAFLMAVAVAASMAFATPVSSPTNTLVMGAGNYRFTDYIKIGVPMILISFVLSMLLLPIIWPF